MGDFVEYFTDKEKCKTDGPGELGFGAGVNGYDAASSKRAGIRLAQALLTAKSLHTA